MSSAATPAGAGSRGWTWSTTTCARAFELCQGDERLAEGALRLASALHWFWFVRGHLREARDRITAALRRQAHVPAIVRARALAAASILSMWVGEFSDMSPLATESLALSREIGDHRTASYALCGIGAATIYGGDTAAPVPLLNEAVALARRGDESRLLVFALFWLGTAELGQGDLEAARRALDEGLAVARKHENRAGAAYTLLRLGEVAAAAGEHDEGRCHFLESLRAMEDSTDRYGMAHVLAALGRLAVSAGQPERGARLLGAVEALCELVGGQILVIERQRSAVATACHALGEPAFAAAWAQGRALGLEQAVTAARAD